MANAGAKLSSFPEVNDIQTGDMFPLLNGGDTNAKIDYATLARAIIAKLKSEDVVQTQTNNANKLISAALAYSMNQDILQLEEDTSTEQEEKSVTAEIVTVNDADGAAPKSLVLNLEPHQSGSGDPSPTNIRPISGYDAVNVTRAGKNLYRYPYANTTHTQDGITWTDNGDGSITVNGTATDYAYFNLTEWFDDRVPLLRKFGAELTVTGGTPQVRIITQYREVGSINAITLGIDNGNGATFTVPETVNEYASFIGIYKGLTISNVTIRPMIREASIEDDSYEDYSSTNYIINIPTSTGTVYHCTINALTGEMTVLSKGVDAKDVAWNFSDVSTTQRIYFSGAKKATSADVAADVADDILLCSTAKTKSFNEVYINKQDGITLSTGGAVSLHITGLTDRSPTAETVTQYFTDNPTTIVYPLDTPLTYQLTPHEIYLLADYNSIWMDADGKIKLDYKTNAIATKGDINEAIARIKALAKITEAIAPVESSYTATQNYSVGDYLIVDYKLYKVTAAIANGGTITPNTNVTATTIMAEIKALA